MTAALSNPDSVNIEPVHVDDVGTEHFAPIEDLHVTRCGMCQQVDNHPKHGFVLNAQTGEETRRHLDCCASVGCPSCALQIKDAGGIQGHELREHLVNLAATVTKTITGA